MLYDGFEKGRIRLLVESVKVIKPMIVASHRQRPGKCKRMIDLRKYCKVGHAD
jgi:hypothetical protein